MKTLKLKAKNKTMFNMRRVADIIDGTLQNAQNTISFLQNTFKKKILYTNSGTFQVQLL
jgi:hypothetical protein